MTHLCYARQRVVSRALPTGGFRKSRSGGGTRHGRGVGDRTGGGCTCRWSFAEMSSGVRRVLPRCRLAMPGVAENESVKVRDVEGKEVKEREVCGS